MELYAQFLIVKIVSTLRLWAGVLLLKYFHRAVSCIDYNFKTCLSYKTSVLENHWTEHLFKCTELLVKEIHCNVIWNIFKMLTTSIEASHRQGLYLICLVFLCYYEWNLFLFVGLPVCQLFTISVKAFFLTLFSLNLFPKK